MTEIPTYKRQLESQCFHVSQDSAQSVRFAISILKEILKWNCLTKISGLLESVCHTFMRTHSTFSLDAFNLHGVSAHICMDSIWGGGRGGLTASLLLKIIYADNKGPREAKRILCSKLVLERNTVLFLKKLLNGKCTHGYVHM